MTNQELETAYRQRRDLALVPITGRLEEDLKLSLREVHHIDRITARAKNLDRFMGKALKMEKGVLKYSDPLHQIQDQVGARVIAFYLEDVESISRMVQTYYKPIEVQAIVPDSEKEFGYFGVHYILPIPIDVKPAGVDPALIPRFFELQIKTLFQHAFSEASHDLAYKPSVQLSNDQKRKVAFTAAQSWGADMILKELFSELSGTPKGEDN